MRALIRDLIPSLTPIVFHLLLVLGSFRSVNYATEEPYRNISHRLRYLKKLRGPCPECGSVEAVVITGVGEVVCRRCGLKAGSASATN